MFGVRCSAFGSRDSALLHRSCNALLTTEPRPSKPVPAYCIRHMPPPPNNAINHQAPHQPPITNHRAQHSITRKPNTQHRIPNTDFPRPCPQPRWLRAQSL